jgi:hypothetical protein
MMVPYRPKMSEKAIAWPFEAPLAAGVADVQVVPFEVSTFPDVPGATNKGADVPLPKMTLFAVSVVAPVPPLATARVPAKVIVPDDVTGPPDVVKPVVPPDTSTLVTEPAPLPAPIAVRKLAASKDETVLSALNRGKVTAEGLVIVNTLEPRVVAPKFVRASGAVVAFVPPRAIGKVPVVPPSIGRPVAFVRVALEGVPKAGVTSVGDVAKTSAPLPVSSVTAAARLLEEGVAKNVATLAPSPLTPVLIGRPVAFVRVALEGVPRAGVTSVGLLDRTTFPVPVEEVTPVPPLATGSVPVTSDVRSMMLEDTITKSEPFQAISALSPLLIVTPVVGPDPTTFTPKPPVVALITTYALDWAGAVIVRRTDRDPVQSSTALRAWLAAPFVVDSVTSTSVLSVVVPATAESSSPVIESLTVVPQVPDRSPVVGSARPRRGEKFVTAISISFTQPFRHFASSECHCHLSLSSLGFRCHLS